MINYRTFTLALILPTIYPLPLVLFEAGKPIATFHVELLLYLTVSKRRIFNTTHDIHFIIQKVSHDNLTRIAIPFVRQYSLLPMS